MNPTSPENLSRGCKNHIWLGASFRRIPRELQARRGDRRSSIPKVLLPALAASQAGEGWKQAGPWGAPREPMTGAAPLYHGLASPAAPSLPPMGASQHPSPPRPPAPVKMDTALWQRCLC